MDKGSANCAENFCVNLAEMDYMVRTSNTVNIFSISQPGKYTEALYLLCIYIGQ